MVEFLKRRWVSFRSFFRYNDPEGKPRVWELDLLRGIILLIVTLDHVCNFIYAFKVLPFETEFGLKIMEYAGAYCNFVFRHAIQPYGLFLLCFLSGINRSLSHSTLLKMVRFCLFSGLFMGGYAFAKVLFPDLIATYLIFNIIPVLTICFVVWWVLDLVKCPDWVRCTLGFIVTLIGLTFYYKYYAMGNSVVENDFLSLLVYNSHGVSLSPDNFEPLLPHLGFFLLGGVLGKYLYKNKKTLTKHTYPPKILRPILIVGKHSLAVYLLAPVVILGLAWIIIQIVHLF